MVGSSPAAAANDADAFFPPEKLAAIKSSIACAAAIDGSVDVDEPGKNESVLLAYAM